MFGPATACTRRFLFPKSGFAWSGERSSEISFLPRWTLRSCAGASMLRITTVPNVRPPRPPVARVRRQAHLRGRAERLEDVRAAAGRRLVQERLGLVLLVGSDGVGAAVRLHDRGVDDSERRVGDDRRDRRVRCLRLEDDRVGAAAGHRDAGEQEGRVALQVDQPAEREDDVLRGQLRPVREAHVLAEGEGVGLRPVRRPVAGRHRGSRMGHVAAHELEESVVEHVRHDAAGDLELALRVGGLEVERLVDHQRLRGGRVGPGAGGRGRHDHRGRHDARHEPGSTRDQTMQHGAPFVSRWTIRAWLPSSRGSCASRAAGRCGRLRLPSPAGVAGAARGGRRGSTGSRGRRR